MRLSVRNVPKFLMRYVLKFLMRRRSLICPKSAG